MTKIQKLFDAYEAQFDGTKNAQSIFSESGMVNSYKKLTYGFFPLGSGILTNKSEIEKAEIKEDCIMILGNDFGTTKYIENDCKNEKEDKEKSKTIKNILTIDSTFENKFFTNFYLGVRDKDKHPEWTMTNMAIKRKKEYQDYCFKFFLTQLEIVNPKVVICMGKKVGFALHDSIDTVFPQFRNRSMVLSKLYNTPDNQYKINSSGTILGNREFVFIPHPSYAHINWTKNDIKGKIKAEIS